MYGQTSIILIVFLISGIMILWLFSTFNQSSLKARILSLTQIDRMSKSIDMIKGLSRNILQLSVHKSTLTTAGKGYVFYCDSKTIPSLNVVLYDLGYQTNATFNEYLMNIKSSDERMIFNVTPAICSTFDIKEDMLYQGKYDEMFNASIFGSSVKVKYGNDEIVSSNDIKDETVVRNRFWRLHRGLKSWVESTNVFNNACGCLSNACGCQAECGSCETCTSLNDCLYTNLVKPSIEELDKIFNDPFIECRVTLEKCDINVESSGCEESSCGKGVLDSRCFVCEKERIVDICEKALLYGLAGAQIPTTTLPIQYSCIVNKKTVKLNVGMTVSCVDTKYSIPSESGQSFLNYVIKIYFSIEQKGLCPETYTGSDPPANACSCTVIQPPVEPPQPTPEPTPTPQPPPPPIP